MVKLPENENHVPVMWLRHERNGDLNEYITPTRLIELEEYADITATYMRAFSNQPTNYRNLWQIAMNRMRQHFNLEFKMFCHNCGTAHSQDEITAPER